MTPPSPAIVAQAAVRRLPRWGLLFLCAAYVLPGFVGRDPWKSEDITAFGYMLAMVQGASAWFTPSLLGLAPDSQALLPYWLGAGAIKALPWLSPAAAARVPFAGLLAICLLNTWYAVYYLASAPQAQPVAFAFGGEANPGDYARAMADGALLALIACLGLAQLSHEATGALALLAGLSLLFYAVAAAPYRAVRPACALGLGLAVLVLSGGAAMAVVIGMGSALLVGSHAWIHGNLRGKQWSAALVVLSLQAAGLAWAMDQWQWRVMAADTWLQWRGLLRLLLWFTWPAWPLALWTVWRWRRQLWGRQMALHVVLPAWFALVALVHALTSPTADRPLLMALPAFAALAAFALPTLRRSFTSLIDWFTLLFFSACVLIIWVVWIAMQTGVPAQPAANVAKLAPGFVPIFSWLTFVIALGCTAAWCALVHWRVGRHRAALWKSMVLPASGAALSWLLLTTLWLPLLDYARSYAPMVARVTALVQPHECIQVAGLTRSQITALQYYGSHRVMPRLDMPICAWLMADPADMVANPVNLKRWKLHASVRHPADRKEDLLLFKRVTAP